MIQHRAFRNGSGITLLELMIAMFILAIAFIPVIASLGSSLSGTEKDDRSITGLQLAQSALAAAIQFPFSDLPTFAGGGTGPWEIGGDVDPIQYPSSPGANEMVMRVGRIKVFKTTYKLLLTIEDVPLTLHFRTYDITKKDKFPTTPSGWGWTDSSFAVQQVHHRYTMAATWTEPDGKTKFCSLVSYKSDLKE